MFFCKLAAEDMFKNMRQGCKHFENRKNDFFAIK